VDDYGWGGDHFRTLKRLRQAVRRLAEGSGKTSDRLHDATYYLVSVHADDFPKHLRKRAETVLSLRGKYAGRDNLYLRDVKPTDRKRFVGDLLALYEACLIDLGRAGPRWSFMYPKDED
jgi:hypothetical protein